MKKYPKCPECRQPVTGVTLQRPRLRKFVDNTKTGRAKWDFEPSPKIEHRALPCHDIIPEPTFRKMLAQIRGLR